MRSVILEQNYVIRVLQALKKDELFLSQKQKPFSIGLSETDIKKVKKCLIDEKLIEQKEKGYVLSKKAQNLIENFVDKFKITNIEYLKLDKTPPTLTKALRALARHLLQGEDLKKDSLEENLKKELLNFKDLKKELEEFVEQEKEVNLEILFNKFLNKGFTKSIVSLLVLNFLAKNKNELAFYEKSQFELNFNPLMFDRMVANPKNFEIKKTILNLDFLGEKINILDKTKELILKFKTLEKITLQTNNLSPKTLKFKNIVLNSKDPMQLFKRDLEKIFSDKKEFKNSIKELENFYNKTLKELEELVFIEFKTDSLEKLKMRFDKIKEFISNKELLILGNNLSSIERFAAFINKKRVPKDWSDLDVSDFKLKVKDFALQFLIVESSVESNECTVEIHTQNLIDEILKLDKIQKNILLRRIA